jgi:tetratricopeptide (TPR) repeat protein
MDSPSFPGGRRRGEPDDTRQGPVAERTNGTPTHATVDEGAVERLNAASALLQEDGHERDAIELASPLVRVFQAAEDYDHLVDCLFLIGEAYYHLGDWPNAEQYMSRAAELGYRYFRDEMSSYPLKVVGEAQFEQGKEEEALSTFRERLHILRRENDVEELGGALFDVGGLLVNTGQFDDALVMLQEARRVIGTRIAELEREGGSDDDGTLEALRVDEGETLYHIAIAYYRSGNLEEAQTYLKRSHQHFSRLSADMQEQVSDRIVSVLDDLVQVSESLEDFASAELYRRLRDELNL